MTILTVAQAKVLVPNMALAVIDKAVQVHGAMGVCQDTPLANMWAHSTLHHFLFPNSQS